MGATYGNSVAGYNNQFMQDNPEYGYNGAPNPTTITPAMQAKTPPVAQSSYQGGQPVPVQGTPAYTQAQGLAAGTMQGSTSSPTQPATNTAAAPTQPQTPLGQAQTGMLNYGNGTGNQNVNTAIGSSQTVANNQGAYAPQIGTNIGTLQGISQNQTPAVTNAQNQYDTFAKNSPILLSDVANNPNVAAEVSVGRGQALGQQLSQEQSALGQNVQNALAGQGQQISAANDASSQSQSAQGQLLGATGQAGSLAQGQQGAQIGALGGAARASAPIMGPGGYLYEPQNNPGSPTQQATNVGTAQTIGQMAANNPAYSAAYTALNGADGQSGINQQMESTLSSNPSLNSMPWSIENGILNLSQQYLQGNPAAVSFLSQANQAIQGYTTILGSGAVQGPLQNIQSQGMGKVMQTLNSLANAKIMGQNAGMSGTSPSSAVSGATPLQSSGSSGQFSPSSFYGQ